MAGKKSKPQTVVNSTGGAEPAQPVLKPPKFDLNKFKSKKSATIAGVGTLQGALPHHNIAAAKDFVRLHADCENYWSAELCFVNVPIQ